MYDEFNFSDRCTILPKQRKEFSSDIDAKLSEAMNQPNDFPSISDAIVAGDRIAIAVSRQVPYLEQILGGMVEHLTEQDIEPSDITIVLPKSRQANGRDPHDVAEFDWKNRFESVRVIRQSEDDPNRIAFLGADHLGSPIYVNRELFDADMVIPVLRHDLGNNEFADGIVPEFCCRQRFDESSAPEQAISNSGDFDADEINDQLGVFFIIEVVVGPGNRIEKIISGSRAAVREQRDQLLDEVWAVEPIAEPDLIVATVEGDEFEQNWQTVTQAVETADRISENSPIVLLTELAEKPNRELKKAIQDEMYGDQHSQPVGGSFQAMADAVGRRPVHLHSLLSEEVVEDLGIGFVRDAADVQRLIDSSDHCVVLRDAHRCRIKN